MSEWGNPLTWNGEHPHMNEIVCGGETRGSEPSKYPQEKKSNEIPPVAASERGGAQTAQPAVARGQPNGLGRPAGAGESPVGEVRTRRLAPCLSRPGHEESWLKQGGPPSKAEYSAATDRA